MFDLGSWGEFLVILMAALILIHPKEIPGLLGTLGKWVTKLRRLTADFKKIIDHQIEEAEIDDYKRNSQKGFEEDIKKTMIKSDKKSKKIKKSAKGSSK